MVSLSEVFIIFCCKLEWMSLYNLKPRSFTQDPVVVVVTRLLPRDGGMAEDHGAPEAGKFPKVWTRHCKETESRQRVSGAKSP